MTIPQPRHLPGTDKPTDRTGGRQKIMVANRFIQVIAENAGRYSWGIRCM
ncbi:hypothetical protein HMPREF9997_02224 [Corynebacterium durum F0235]|uniref:Uncharacterized protein n=1 Tax=Corynebacterium durum F0235 TaxID=1035195 RepID=L1MBZ2_9CORY|nr:hypothetical protein HMPREF9997_02224 [Corynebacterium durum F0235]